MSTTLERDALTATARRLREQGTREGRQGARLSPLLDGRPEPAAQPGLSRRLDQLISLTVRSISTRCKGHALVTSPISSARPLTAAKASEP